MKKRLKLPVKPFIVFGVCRDRVSGSDVVERLAGYRSLNEARIFAVALLADIAVNPFPNSWFRLFVTGRKGERLAEFQAFPVFESFRERSLEGAINQALSADLIAPYSCSLSPSVPAPGVGGVNVSPGGN